MSSSLPKVTEIHASELAASLRRDALPDTTILALFSDPQRRDRASFVGLRGVGDARACPACAGVAAQHAETCRGSVHLLRQPDGEVLEPCFDKCGLFRGVRTLPRERRDDWAGLLLDLFRSEPNERAFLQAALHLMRDLLRCRYGAVGIVEEDALAQFLVSGLEAEEIAAIGPAPRGRGLLGLELRTGESLRLEDLAQHPFAEGFPAGHPQMRTLMIVPVSSGSEVYGRLYFCDRVDRRPFDEQDERRASALAALMARLVGLQRHVRTIAELDERLKELERIEVSARIAAEAAHDLANVLSAVSGYCELLHGESSSSLRRSYVTGIELAVSRAIDLVRSVLRVSRGEDGAGASTRFDTVAETLAPLLRAVLGKHVSLAIEIERDLAPLAVDASELEMALLNLALNSKTAMPGGGSLVIRVGRVGTDPDASPLARIEVEDSGPGFDLDALEQAQAPDQPLRPGRNGLGLRSVRRFVERAGGALEIRTNPGQGALVRMQLPLQAPINAAEQGTVSASSRRTTPQETTETRESGAVLLCASGADNDAHCDHLAAYGLGSMCAESVAAALERARSTRTRLLIVLADEEPLVPEQVEALGALPADIALAILSERPERSDALARFEGRAAFLDRTMPTSTISAELRRLLAPRPS